MVPSPLASQLTATAAVSVIAAATHGSGSTVTLVAVAHDAEAQTRRAPMGVAVDALLSFQKTGVLVVNCIQHPAGKVLTSTCAVASPPLSAANWKHSAMVATAIRPLSAQVPLVAELLDSEWYSHGLTMGGGGGAVHALKSSVLHASAAASCAPHS